LRLTPGEFEDFVGDLLTVTGQYRDVRRVGGTGDRGADLLARDRFGRPFIVQCKRYQPGRKVNAGEMRNFLGAKGIYRADECLFVTTSTFTEAARANMAHMQHTVFLWDGAKLTQLIEEYWSALPAHWQRFFMEQRINIID
jgi:restriction endonuclease Mrr